MGIANRRYRLLIRVVGLFYLGFRFRFRFRFCFRCLFFVTVCKYVGDGECTVFVKVHTAKDRWARTGWCFETFCHGDEERKAVLERTSSPRKEVTKRAAVVDQRITVDQTY